MYLIDTHILLWMLSSPDKLSKKVVSLLESENSIYVSIVSLWEIAIKQNLNKLDLPFLPSKLAQICNERNIKIIPITPEHLDELKSLPFIHNDPFDRLLIAQAKNSNATLITRDSFIPQYDIKTLW